MILCLSDWIFPNRKTVDFNFTGLANRGEYQSILIDFKDDIPVSVLDEQLNAINKKAGKTTSLNSIFSDKVSGLCRTSLALAILEGKFAYTF